ncbi:5-methylcytosine restriction system specificity protein McrC [Nonlabens ulvanivorans]|uniref:5-methylcytosine restriction system specificity protein McrC n=1 Tax=Nonlabens ulvanivorans TaxID=906888 RepID=UPI002943F494|nr:hypothetical protein [Nonlabens ulvanivorans]WOI21623.1 hypothetical protein R1T42_08000 [Nonlabens ulvanivorans]
MLRLPEQYNYGDKHNPLLEKHNASHVLDVVGDYEHSFLGGKNLCFSLQEKEQGYRAETSYYIGIDHIGDSGKVIHVQPKLDDEERKIDYYAVLEQALSGNLKPSETKGLFEIKFNQPLIPIDQEQDYLSPLLFAQFLNLLKSIVHKGLRKSYYRVEHNMTAKVKGKILVGATIRNNHVHGRMDRSVCSFEEYGLDHFENRLLKKALLFVSANLHTHKTFKSLKKTVAFCRPAFTKVSETVNENQVNNFKVNPFFKEYAAALKLAKLILKRYGFKLENATSEKVATPPFWIDMSKIFELYVYRQLEKANGIEKLLYEPVIDGLRPDFLIKSNEFTGVIDAKYKPRYKTNKIDVSDFRQVLGYARMTKVYDELEISKDSLIDCLIIYSNQAESDLKVELEKKVAEEGYVRFWKLGIKLPEIGYER